MFGTRVLGRRVNVCVGNSVRVGSAVAVGSSVLVDVLVGDGISVAVAGGFVATTWTMRVVGEGGGVGAIVSGAHAAAKLPRHKKTSEHQLFACFKNLVFIGADCNRALKKCHCAQRKPKSFLRWSGGKEKRVASRRGSVAHEPPRYTLCEPFAGPNTFVG